MLSLRGQKTLPTLKPRVTLVLHVTRVGTIHMSIATRGRITEQTHGRINQHGRQSAKDSSREEKVELQITHPGQSRASSRINDNYCVDKLQAQLVPGSQSPDSRKTLTVQFLETHVNFPAVKHQGFHKGKK